MWNEEKGFGFIEPDGGGDVASFLFSKNASSRCMVQVEIPRTFQRLIPPRLNRSNTSEKQRLYFIARRDLPVRVNRKRKSFNLSETGELPACQDVFVHRTSLSGVDSLVQATHSERKLQRRLRPVQTQIFRQHLSSFLSNFCCKCFHKARCSGLENKLLLKPGYTTKIISSYRCWRCTQLLAIF